LRLRPHGKVPDGRVEKLREILKIDKGSLREQEVSISSFFQGPQRPSGGKTRASSMPAKGKLEESLNRGGTLGPRQSF
jgi:hypothetical protein